MEGGRKNVLLIAALASLLLSLTFAVASAATTSGITIQVAASPNQVQEDQSFVMTALISNAGKTSFQSFNVSLVTPKGWSQVMHESQALGDAVTVRNGTQPGSYVLGPLLSNQTDILQVDVTVPPGTLPGSYTIFLLTNPASSGGEAQATLIVPVQGTAALPLGSAAIPVSLVLILLPGFVTIMIVIWSIGRTLDVTWQTGLAFTFLAFFAGFLEWYGAGYLLSDLGPPPHQTLLATTILNLDLSTISAPYYILVAVFAVIGGLAGLAVVLGVNKGKDVLQGWYQTRFSGYIVNNEKVWTNVLKSSIAEAITVHGGGWAPLVRVTTSSDASKAAASKPSPSGNPPGGSSPPQVTKTSTTTTTNLTKVHTPGKPGDASGPETVQEKLETNATTSQSTEPSKAAPTSPTKESGVLGILYSFDDATPFDLVIGPQYTLTIEVGSGQWRALKKMIKPPLPKELDPDQSQAGNFDVKRLEEALNSTMWPRTFQNSMRGVTRQRVDNKAADSEHDAAEWGAGKEPPKEGIGLGIIGNLPVIGEPSHGLVGAGSKGISLGGPKWIKGSDVLSIEVLDPQPIYLLRFTLPKSEGKQRTP